MRNAVYVKNRVYNKGTKEIPYEMMFGVKPDVHHIRNFEALAYVHIPVSPGRKKHHENAKIGFVLGYAEDVVGCMVYFPEEHTAKFVPDLKVAEYVVYRDCHAAALKEDDLSLLHFTHQADEGKNTESDNSDIDMVIVSPEKHHPLDSRKASMRTMWLLRRVSAKIALSKDNMSAVVRVIKSPGKTSTAMVSMTTLLIVTRTMKPKVMLMTKLIATSVVAMANKEHT
ncbi:hypothetical protein Pcac1_g7741 [Phytophthora cactorum]|nr:hypothetical protein Pcac1_g7741 [Phytophthora cactorum]